MPLYMVEHDTGEWSTHEVVYHDGNAIAMEAVANPLSGISSISNFHISLHMNHIVIGVPSNLKMMMARSGWNDGFGIVILVGNATNNRYRVLAHYVVDSVPADTAYLELLEDYGQLLMLNKRRIGHVHGVRNVGGGTLKLQLQISEQMSATILAACVVPRNYTVPPGVQIASVLPNVQSSTFEAPRHELVSNGFIIGAAPPSKIYAVFHYSPPVFMYRAGMITGFNDVSRFNPSEGIALHVSCHVNNNTWLISLRTRQTADGIGDDGNYAYDLMYDSGDEKFKLQLWTDVSNPDAGPIAHCAIDAQSFKNTSVDIFAHVLFDEQICRLLVNETEKTVNINTGRWLAWDTGIQKENQNHTILQRTSLDIHPEPLHDDVHSIHLFDCAEKALQTVQHARETNADGRTTAVVFRRTDDAWTRNALIDQVNNTATVEFSDTVTGVSDTVLQVTPPGGYSIVSVFVTSDLFMGSTPVDKLIPKSQVCGVGWVNLH